MLISPQNLHSVLNWFKSYPCEKNNYFESILAFFIFRIIFSPILKSLTNLIERIYYDFKTNTSCFDSGPDTRIIKVSKLVI
jgi:hypothetical protein